MAQDRISQHGELRLQEGRLGAPRDEEFLRSVGGPKDQDVIDSATPHGLRGAADDVVHGPEHGTIEGAVDRIPLKLFHVPGPVDLKVSPELEQTLVGHQEGAALDRQHDDRALIRLEMLPEQGEPVGIPFRRTSEAEKSGRIERVRIAHRDRR